MARRRSGLSRGRLEALEAAWIAVWMDDCRARLGLHPIGTQSPATREALAGLSPDDVDWVTGFVDGRIVEHGSAAEVLARRASR